LCSYEKTALGYNKPVYLGMSLLDLSKTLMDEFHHGYMKKTYGQKRELLFTNRLRTAFVMKFIK